MLLRSITKHIKDQNWFAVSLDFLIVVAGILIALQITNWNEQRENEARIELRLSNLLQDLKQDIETIEGVLEGTEWRLSAIYTILKESGNPIPLQYSMPGGEIIDIEVPPPFESQLPNSANDAITFNWTFHSKRGSYETIINTGDLYLIRDQNLISAVQDYYARIDQWEALSARASAMLFKMIDSKIEVGIGVDDTSYEQIVATASADDRYTQPYRFTMAMPRPKLRTLHSN